MEKSLDYKLFMAFHGCIMVLLILHFALRLGIHFEVAFVTCAVLVLLTVSIRNRRRLGWRWPGAKLSDVFASVVGAVLIVFFFGAILPGHSPFNPNVFPWLAGGANFLAFAVLSSLKVVSESNDEFLRNCGDYRFLVPPPPPPQPTGPQLRGWRRVVTGVFTVVFMAVWIAGVSFFWKFNLAWSHGSPQPTATQTAILRSHGHSVYITQDEKRTVDFLETTMAFSIPSVIALGFLLHFVVRDKAGRRRPRV